MCPKLLRDPGSRGEGRGRTVVPHTCQLTGVWVAPPPLLRPSLLTGVWVAPPPLLLPSLRLLRRIIKLGLSVYRKCLPNLTSTPTSTNPTRSYCCSVRHQPWRLPTAVLPTLASIPQCKPALLPRVFSSISVFFPPFLFIQWHAPSPPERGVACRASDRPLALWTEWAGGSAGIRRPDSARRSAVPTASLGQSITFVFLFFDLSSARA